MALRVTTFKKPKAGRVAAMKTTPVEKFLRACETQIKIVNGKTVKHPQTKKPIESWVKEIHGQQAVCPKVGNSKLFGKNKGYAITGKLTAEKILIELMKEVSKGTHVRVINKIAKDRLAKAKKRKKPKKGKK